MKFRLTPPIAAISAALMALSSYAVTWSVGYDETEKKSYLESSDGWKLWVYTSNQKPTLFTVGGVKGYRIFHSETSSRSAIETANPNGILDLSDVATEGGEFPVVSFGKYAFYGETVRLFQVKAPDCREVLTYTFAQNSALTDIEISPEATDIFGWGSYDGCTSLVRFKPTVLPNVTVIQSHGGFNKLTALTGDWSFPGMISTGESLFSGCSSITSVRFDNMTATGYSFCKGCTSLTNAVLPNLVTLTSESFNGCTSLKTVTMGAALTTIMSKGFYGCSSLERIEAQGFAGLQTVGPYAFSGCTSFRGTLSLPEVLSVDSFAFEKAAFDEIYAPKLENTVGNGSYFVNMPNLAKATIGGIGETARYATFYNVNTANNYQFALYWKGTALPLTPTDSACWLAPWYDHSTRARLYCRGAAMRAWLAKLTGERQSPTSTFRLAKDFEAYGDNTKDDYPGEIARALVYGVSKNYFWLCDWDYEGDVYDATIACPADVGVGDVLVDGELILPRNGVYRIPQTSTLTITYVAQNGKRFQGGSDTYVKENVPAAAEIPASTCDKPLQEVEKRKLTLSLAELAEKNIAEVTLVCANAFTCETNDNVVTWQVMNAAAFDLVYGCAGLYRFEGRAKTLTVAYADGITADTAVDLSSVETPKEYEPLWSVVYDPDERQSYLVNDLLGWKFYLQMYNQSVYLKELDGAVGYVIWRPNNPAVVVSHESGVVDFTNVERDTGHPVVYIGEIAFAGSNVRRVIAPECRFIGNAAFNNCAQLGFIEMSPAASDPFGPQPFNGCSSFTNLVPTVFTNVTSIGWWVGTCALGGDWVFPKAEIVTSGATWSGTNENGFTVSLPVCTNIATSTLRGSRVTRVSLPALKSLPAEMCGGCAWLREVELSDELGNIGNKAFSGCSSLTNVSQNVLPAVTNMGIYAFSSCSSLVGPISFPALTNLNENSFKDCWSLKSLSAPKALTQAYAFCGCTSLTEIVIGGIGLGANHLLTDCASIADIYITDAWDPPAARPFNCLSKGGYGDSTTVPPVVHVRADLGSAAYAAWQSLCSCTRANLYENAKKWPSYERVRHLIGYIGGNPTVDKEGNITHCYDSNGDIAWVVRWPPDRGLSVIIR